MLAVSSLSLFMYTYARPTPAALIPNGNSFSIVELDMDTSSVKDELVQAREANGLQYVEQIEQQQNY